MKPSLWAIFTLFSASLLRSETLKDDEQDEKQKCKARVDIGFLLDSSGSLRYDYHKEKDFLKALVRSFGLGADDSRAAVITFSTFARHSIRLNEFTDVEEFCKAVDAIPLRGFITMIDRALRLAQREMFLSLNGGRPDVRKLLVLLTDGTQTKFFDWEDPSTITDELRRSGINVIVVGIGRRTNRKELDRMAGGIGESFNAQSFDYLLSEDFTSKLTNKTCKAATVSLCQLDIGFILDSSGSINKKFLEEKKLAKDFVRLFDVGDDTTRAGVIIFSDKAIHVIKLKAYQTTDKFTSAVDSLPLMNSTTRIDSALRLADDKFFSLANGARTFTRKIVVLFTDGKQTLVEGREDRGLIAELLREKGVRLIVVGTGNDFDVHELDRMAGGRGKSLTTQSFKEKMKDDRFIREIAGDYCVSGPNSSKVVQKTKKKKTSGWQKLSGSLSVAVKKLQ